jgi:hypothetical protein
MSKKKIQDGFNTIPSAPEPKSKESHGGSAFLVCTMLVLLFLVVLIILIRMDVGGFGTNVLRPILKDVPVVNRILPEPTDEEVAAESGYKNLNEAVTKIEELEAQIAALEEQQTTAAASGDSALQEQIDKLQQENATLKVYENNQKTFESTKAQFYEDVVYNDNVDVSDYTKWYESMDADTAAKLYKEAVQTQEASERVKELAQSYAKMKPAQAADILEQMTGDMDTVVAILEEMNATDRGKIMGEMNSAFAAKVTKKMSTKS